MKTNTYDIIIAGAGLAGLSLAYYLSKEGYKGNVLITDSSFAPHNKKTWCFWNKTKPPFKNLIYKQWRKTFFSALDFDAFLYMKDFTYYAIRESDFKEYVLRKLKRHSNFHLLEEAVLDFSTSKKKAVMVTKNSDTYIADYIFQSIFNPDSAKKKRLKYPLLQHFYGLEVEIPDNAFDAEAFTIMDIDESFEDGFAFMYVLPFRHNCALFEYTVFSKKTLKKKDYKKKIREYLYEKYGYEKNEYAIHRKEFGKIPMDDRPYDPFLDKGIYNIGTVGGFTKPSTGYTFTRVQEYTQQLARSIVRDEVPAPPPQAKFKYRYYDLLLLHILSNSTEDSHRVFRNLFKNNHIDDLFAFLNEETHFLSDLKIMSSVPYSPFLRAITKNLG
ncbi:MAG: lycopene cyclase family protein [Balneolales bacterium]|nr:lycopene cyclase family protein [Balneolales bacterium]